ncbi:MAG TPA: hypothetical protein VGM90_01260 [Kofleriaceae bacterium]|jgi:hypothetical protein
MARNGFRETLWFKKGSQDAEAAQAAQRAKRGTLDPGGVDQLPVEDRYEDDGTLTAVDTAQWSVKTGTTQPIAPIRDVVPVDERVQAKAVAAVVTEMKKGHAAVMGVIGASAVAVAVIVAMFFA